MLATSSSGVPDPDVLFTPLDNGEAVLLQLCTKKYYSLNVTGSRIWQLMSQGLSLEEISSEMEAGFEVTIHRARQCVMELASRLSSESLARFTSDQ